MSDPTPPPPSPDPSSPGGLSDPTAPMPQSPAPKPPGSAGSDPTAPMPQAPAPGYPAQPGYPPQGGYPAQPGYPPQPGYPAPEGYPADGGYPPPGGGYPPGQPAGGHPYQPGHPGPAAFGPPAKSRGNRVVIFVVLGIVLLLLLCGGACVAGFAFLRTTAESVEREIAEATSAPFAPPPSPPDPLVPPGEADGEAAVVYEVTGDGPASITYTDEAGRPRQLRDVDLPWRTELTVPNRTLIMLIAVRGGTDEGDIGCRLSVDGAEASTKQASGFIASANCSNIGG